MSRHLSMTFLGLQMDAQDKWGDGGGETEINAPGIKNLLFLLSFAHSVCNDIL